MQLRKGKNMDNLKWVTKGHTQTFKKDTADVSISIVQCATAENGILTRFAFKNNCQYKITDTGYIVFARQDNRIYFKVSNAGKGFKLSYMNSINTLVDLSEFKGGYMLNYDELLDLYYIELNKK